MHELPRFGEHGSALPNRGTEPWNPRIKRLPFSVLCCLTRPPKLDTLPQQQYHRSRELKASRCHRHGGHACVRVCICACVLHSWNHINTFLGTIQMFSHSEYRECRVGRSTPILSLSEKVTLAVTVDRKTHSVADLLLLAPLEIQRYCCYIQVPRLTLLLMLLLLTYSSSISCCCSFGSPSGCNAF